MQEYNRKILRDKIQRDKVFFIVYFMEEKRSREDATGQRERKMMWRTARVLRVELLIEGKSFVSLPRMHMMWFFHNDIIHHRGQLSAYIRPMGGKNPAVYGYSFDTLGS